VATLRRQRWGPSITQYLDPSNSTMKEISSRVTPSLETVQRSIQRLEKWHTVTYSMLEEALAILHYPKDLYTLDVLQLNLNCMKLLQEYTAKHKVRVHP
jgi:transcriptional antiterminator